MLDRREPTGLEVAVVGIALRFPGADGVDQFWDNLRDGVESISTLSDDELRAAGVPPSIYEQKNYVRADAKLDGIDLFDAQFFGYSPREAEMLDPQHRAFLECGWLALERAGYDAERFDGLIGVFGGVGVNTYYLQNLLSHPRMLETADGFQIGISNDKDSLTSRVAYKLGLTGPSMTIQTACSTSLVATHVACQALLNGECDLALAGGVTIAARQGAGYLYEEGGILSPDGHCRSFDAAGEGTVGGSGVGIVVLRRLEDAVEQGDHVHAVILGSAVNNDGARRVGFTAPGVDGQAAVVHTAHLVAGVSPNDITFVEGHGTATSLGDPIEIAALTRAFRSGTDDTGYCAIGSVKSNVGHLDAAAGVAGLIKAVLALEHRQIPASLHFESPNPHVDLAASPFYVNAALTDWHTERLPRRAGVSSFGLGGVNAHVVLEEPPLLEQPTTERSHHLLLISAASAAALDDATTQLGAHLARGDDDDVAGAAYTLQVGRRRFHHRRFVVCDRVDQAVAALASPSMLETRVDEVRNRPVIFLFPGGGAQYPGMGAGLYAGEPVYQRAVERCGELLVPFLTEGLVELLVNGSPDALRRPALALPALFAVEYALAELWSSLGVTPAAMIGHSLGEYAAACTSGVMSLPAALELVAARGRLMETLPSGAMLAVSMPERDLQDLVGAHTAIAAINGPEDCVISGTVAEIESIAALLARKSVPYQRIHIDVAAHSAIVTPILEEFGTCVGGVELNEPRIPFASNLTGTWISASAATDPTYWVRHLRHTVRFADGVAATLARHPDAIFLEVGPGQVLTTLADRIDQRPDKPAGVASLRHARDSRTDAEFILASLGRLWLAGVEVDWTGLWPASRGRRPLPTYPFQRERFWVEPDPGGARADSELARRTDVAEFFHVPSWRRSVPPPTGDGGPARWLVYADPGTSGWDVVQRLVEHGRHVTTVARGRRFERIDASTFTVRSSSAVDHRRLVDGLAAAGEHPSAVLHLWYLGDDAHRDDTEPYQGLLNIIQSLAAADRDAVRRLTVAASHLQRFGPTDRVSPASAMMVGLGRVAAQELPSLVCHFVDAEPATTRSERLADRLVAEALVEEPPSLVAWRGDQRWVSGVEQVHIGRCVSVLRDEGVYLVIGGLGRVGRVISRHLTEHNRTRLVLLGRTALPPEELWSAVDDDAIREAIEHVRNLRARGAEVLVLAADVSDQGDMEAALAAADDRFGRLDGVFHAAAITDRASTRCPIEEIEVGLCEVHFRPKVAGLRVLAEVLRDRPLDFCLLVSSNASVLGGLGFGVYAAANAFMDAFAADQGGVWKTSNWDGWPGSDASSRSEPRSSIDGYGLVTAESGEALERLLAADVEQVMVSAADLPARWRLWVDGPLRAGPMHVEGEVPATPHPRPPIRTVHRSPSTDLERTVEAIWSQHLGIEDIGIDDNFFELGGHSLLASQIMASVRAAVQLEIPLERFFVEPTIAGLAARVAEVSFPDDLDELLDEIEAMSDEELDRALQRSCTTEPDDET